MVIDPHSANLFITEYKKVLLEVHKLSKAKPQKQLIQKLSTAREKVVEDPSLINSAVASLRSNGEVVHPDVLCAINTLKCKQWVFLRDTKTYSIFIDPDEDTAYGVLGLTDPIRDILGGSGITFISGLLSYHGRYVCDGIIGDPIWLGSSLKSEFNSLFADIKKENRFYKVCPP